MTNKAAGDIEYGCEGCRLSTYRQPIFHYYVDWCPKCGIERRFFTMASYAVNEKLRQQFHNDVRKAIRLPDGVKAGPWPVSMFKPGGRKPWWAFWRKA